MKNFIKKHNSYITLIAIVLLIASICYLTKDTYAIDTNTPINISYDSIKQGDIIPFGSTIVGNLKNRIYKTGYGSSDGYSVSSSVEYFASSLKIYYCKTRDCLETKEYGHTYTLTSQSNVPFYPTIYSYERMFINGYSNTADVIEQAAKYKAWEVFLVKNNEINAVQNGRYTSEKYNTVGDYFDIVLIPTEKDEKYCDASEKTYYKTNEIGEPTTVIKFTKTGNAYFVSSTLTTPAVLEYKFNATKGDILRFDMMTDKTGLTFTLNGKTVTPKLLGINVDSIENYVTYSTYTIDIDKTGENVLTIQAGLTSNERYGSSSSVNLKDFILLTYINKGTSLDLSKVTSKDSVIEFTSCSNKVAYDTAIEVPESTTTTTTTATTTKVTTTEKVEEEKVENPKTGITDYIALLVIALLLAVIFIANQDRLKLFKKI